MNNSISGDSVGQIRIAKDPEGKTLYPNKPIVLSYNIVKNPYFQNLKMEKDGYNENFGKNCFELFLIEMLEIKISMEP